MRSSRTIAFLSTALAIAPAFAQAVESAPPTACSPVYVFFQSDEAALAPEALPAIAAGAQTLVKDNLSATVAGHTDGLEGDDRVLSQRRAEAVKRELVRLGVKADKLETSGQGLSEPMTPSAPGVAESFNRYVIIDFCGLDRFTK